MIGLVLSLSLSLTLRLVVRGELVLVLLLLLHFHFHVGRLLVRPCLCWCGLLQRSSRAQRDARSGPLIQVRPGTVRQGGFFLVTTKSSSQDNRRARSTMDETEEARGTDSRMPRSTNDEEASRADQISPDQSREGG